MVKQALHTSTIIIAFGLFVASTTYLVMRKHAAKPSEVRLCFIDWRGNTKPGICSRGSGRSTGALTGQLSGTTKPRQNSLH